MEREQLHIVFKDEEDKNVIIKIDNPVAGIDSIQIEGVAEIISQSDVFGFGLIPVRAEIVTTSTETFYLNT